MSDAREPVPTDPQAQDPLDIEARWETPLIAVDGGEATLLVRVSAPEQPAATRRVPLDVAFVLDRSGSMAGDKLTLAKDGVALATSRLRDADRVALVVYDDAVSLLQPLAAATPRVKAALRLTLHGVDPGGSTNLAGGWVAGCQQLAEAPLGGDGQQSRVRRAILLTDGLANIGMTDPQELAQHAGQLRQRGIATTALGVGQDFDEGLLSAMAEAGGGNFMYAPDAQTMRDFFAQELQELFRVAVTTLQVTLALPPGARAAVISAFPAQVRGGALDVAIGDVIAGDAIDLIFAVHVERGTLGSRLPFGVIAAWTDPHADARRTRDVSPAPLRRVGRAEIVSAERDPLVTELAALQRAAAERRAGLNLDRAGRHAESRDRMRSAHDLLRAAPQSDAVRQDLEESSLLAEASESAAYGSHQRKAAQHAEELRRRGRYSRTEREDTD